MGRILLITGRAQTVYGEYYIRNGQIDFGFNGTVQAMSGTYKCYQNGKLLDWDFNGLVEIPSMMNMAGIM